MHFLLSDFALSKVHLEAPIQLAISLSVNSAFSSFKMIITYDSSMTITYKEGKSAETMTGLKVFAVLRPHLTTAHHPTLTVNRSPTLNHHYNQKTNLHVHSWENLSVDCPVPCSTYPRVK